MCWRSIYLQFQNVNLAKVHLYYQLTLWYSNVLIELFQIEFSLSQRNDKPIREDTKLINNFVEYFICAQRLLLTNRHVLSFRFTNCLVRFFFSGRPLSMWLIVPRGWNKERRVAVKLFRLRAVFITVVTQL